MKKYIVGFWMLALFIAVAVICFLPYTSARSTTVEEYRVYLPVCRIAYEPERDPVAVMQAWATSRNYNETQMRDLVSICAAYRQGAVDYRAYRLRDIE